MNKNYIWSLPTRVFHWSFVLLIVICYLTGDDKTILIHAISGYLLVVALLFRFGWGYVGPKYSKFKDFSLSFKKLKEFALNIFKRKTEDSLGHNPMASYVMVGILLVVTLIIITGCVTYGSYEAKGFFGFLQKDKLYKHIHEFFANFLYFLIFLHLCGIAVDTLFHRKTKTLKSIFNGFKQSNKEENIKLNIFQKFYALIFLLGFIGFFLYLLIDKTNPFLY
ncbi:cytochrome b/b6 domain-containing protein [Halarcobacter anaerophilus]|uniref:Cytochrome B n=1 Tax=Halarcobacter anaerophilus TaxID=877500 RepID=A0A4Q0XVI8_9BACT|nr:cytochrome b/b6 domain-containing protein [Halarcobacter anaerophilus]QDF30397.1 cytochrome b [Halarcobacter anaerophilus]RXJ61516.1 cytochrome B [Halarcobacter anaerophilus]